MRRERDAGGASCAAHRDSDAVVFVPVDENVGQVVVQTELKQAIAGRGDRPAVFVMVIHNQAVGLCAVTETTVMVSAASGAILDPVHIAVVMHHFMKQGGCDFLDGPCQSTGTDVDLVSGTLFADPSVITKGEVAIGLGSRLDGYGRS